MPVGRGYKLPDIIDPGEFRCLRIFIPNDDFYLYAFMGAYQFMTTWTAWEKDGTNRAALAAYVWKQAYDLTIENEGYACISEDDIVTEIINNITTNCGCGCSENPGGNVEINVLPNPTSYCFPLPIADDPPPPGGTMPPDPPPDTTPSEWDTERCRRANYAYDLILGMMTTLAEIDITGGVIGQIILWITQLVNSTVLGQIGGQPLLQLAQWLMYFQNNITQFNDFWEWIIEYWIDEKENIICAFYNGQNYQEEAEAIRGAIVVAVQTWAIGQMWPSNLIEAAIGIIVNMLTDAVFWLFFWVDVPEEYAGNFNCSVCLPATTPGNWYFEPVNASEPFPTLTSPSQDIIQFSGPANRGSVTGILLRANLEGYDNITGIGHEGLAAVAFTIETLTHSGGYTPNGDNGLFFGSANEATLLTDLIPGGGTVLIQREGYEQGDSGMFDVVLTYDEPLFLVCSFYYKRFGYQPGPDTFTLSIEDFELRSM